MDALVTYLQRYVGIVAVVIFAVTGITLNHPELSSSLGKTSQQLQLELPEQLPDLLALPDDQQQAAMALYVDWLKQDHQLQGGYNLNFRLKTNCWKSILNARLVTPLW